MVSGLLFQRFYSMGHRELSREQRPKGMGHRAWNREQRA